MKKILLILVALAVLTSGLLAAGITLNIKLDFFGTPQAGQKGSSVTTSFYLKSIVQRNLHVAFSAEALEAELKKTFNAPGLTLLAEGDLAWKSGGEPSVTQIVQIDGRDLALVLTPLPKPGAVNFKVGVVEESGGKNIKNILLDTEIILPDGEVAILGFRDMLDRSYFIAFCVQGREEKTSPGVKRLRAGQQPKKIKEVMPAYPPQARKEKIQGVVIGVIEADAQGRVAKAEVISGHPLLNEAALAAVRQWEFEPHLVDGRAIPVSFTFTVSFLLDEGKTGDADAVSRLEGAQKPKLLKMVRPAYPKEAVEQNIEGVVVMEAMIGADGKVRAIRVVNTPNELLNQAAMEALKQWEYEPVVKDGKAVPATFTVTITFVLSKEKKPAKAAKDMMSVGRG